MRKMRYLVFGMALTIIMGANACTAGAGTAPSAPSASAAASQSTPDASQIGMSGPQLPPPGNPGISKQQQIQAGLQAAKQVYQQMPVLPDSSPLTQYVRQLGAQLVRQIPSQNSWPYQFHVIAEKDINAFALPGGQIFINQGAIAAAGNTAELAGVMAHEMSHVYLQHSAKMAVKQQQTQGLAAIGAGILGAILGNGTAGAIANTGVNLAAGLYSLKYSRQDEAQADATGAILMYKAGYNPRYLALFFQKLESQGGPGAPQFLSDHPNPGNRVANVDREIAHWPAETYTTNYGEFASIHNDAQRLPAYTAQQISAQAKSGYWAQWNRQHGANFNPDPAMAQNTSSASQPAGNAPPAASALAHVRFRQVRPGGSMQTFQGSVFSIAYPSNWQATSDPNSGGATIAPAQGAANGQIAYGVVIGGSNQMNGTLAQTTQTLAQGLEQSNAGLSITSGAQPISVAGVAGETLTLRGQSPVQQNGQPIAEHDWLVTLPRPQGGMLYLVFIAPQRDFAKLQPVYQQMLNSLQVR